MKRALLSVSDKTGIVELGQALAERGWELVSTGGTARTLREAGLDVKGVADLTGHPEMMDGRVKTLHPAIHAGLLARRDREDDMAALAEHGYGPIDLVAVNLYPFRQTVTGPDYPIADAMEVVDIGGPTMLRAAAKSHRDVLVVVDPADYAAVIQAIDGGSEQGALRRRLASKVFGHVSAYDAAIARYLDRAEGAEGGDPLPESIELAYQRVQVLRYGENPDQEAAFYGAGTRVGLTALMQLHGKELSYNNLLDLDGALLCLSPFAYSGRPVVCIVKHTTPCGLGLGDTLAKAYAKALATDPTSAFGSVISTNRPVDAATADLMSTLFIECVVAPGFEDDALSILTQKKNVRLLVYRAKESFGAALDAPQGAGEGVPYLAAFGRAPTSLQHRSVYGGLLVQTAPTPPWYIAGAMGGFEVATQRAPTDAEWDDLRFAWSAIFGVKSNAILLARDGGVLGIGAGQMSRVDSSKIAVRKAGESGLDLQGAVLASDAFFPFRDGVDAAANAGIAAVVQPGGSVRDDEVIAAADGHGIAMVFTRRRLFRH